MAKTSCACHGETEERISRSANRHSHALSEEEFTADSLSPRNATGGRGAITRLQQSHGNAFVAKRLESLARSSAEEPKKPGPPEPWEGMLPPGYRKGGTVIQPAKPRPCGLVLEYVGNERQPRARLGHIQTNAHWIAHELDIKTGEKCEGGFAIQIKDMILDRYRVPFPEGDFEDLWTDGKDDVGFVTSIISAKDSGQRSYEVTYFNPATCKDEKKTVTGGLMYRENK